MLSFENMCYEGMNKVESISPPLYTSHFVCILVP